MHAFIISLSRNLKNKKTSNLTVCNGNGGPNLNDPLEVPDAPITMSRVKKIKEAMQGLVQSTWA
jgi:hypothetical protein